MRIAHVILLHVFELYISIVRLSRYVIKAHTLSTSLKCMYVGVCTRAYVYDKM